MDDIQKSILIVDDEPDILETLEELLDTYRVHTASTYEDAVNYLKKNTYDVAILDIMGVSGYDLLEITHKLNIPTLMCTAHALSPSNLKKSIKLGADAYIPKDKLVDITLYIEDVLKARDDRAKAESSWFVNLTPFFNKLFGKEWQDPEKEFWDEFDKKN
jgi:DNA-binding response OmpR family regulator